MLRGLKNFDANITTIHLLMPARKKQRLDKKPRGLRPWPFAFPGLMLPSLRAWLRGVRAGSSTLPE
jgi:hypothetical protein